MIKKLKITKEQLEEVIKISINITDLVKKVKEKYGIGSYKNIFYTLKKHNIDISRFESSKERRNRSKLKRIKSKDEIINKFNNVYFILNSKISRNCIKTNIIKNKLIEYKCNECGCNDDWRGKKMPLILDHKNGINNDNRLENLRFLCPNCNSIQDTFCGKNISKLKNKELIQTKKCLNCKNILPNNKSKYCNKRCLNKYYKMRKVALNGE